MTPNRGHPRGDNGASRLGGRDDDIVDHYPRLLDLYEWSQPLDYAPGDATVHHAYTVHGAPANSTGRPRWAYLVRYASADVHRYEVKAMTPFDDEVNPLLPVS
jgi:ectoine hydroxylase-related dioxygenase (phytanoyl-CoA dioxygenase family)